MSTLVKLFAGSIQPLPPDGHPSGIFKKPVSGPVFVGLEGLEGDSQADHRFHGGVEKAVHHYAAENYPQLEKILQCKPGFLVPGILGENISTLGWDERSVCIGDVFAIGQVRLQVSQPRSPCWKINRRLEIDSASKAMVQARLTGWYYRVLACGSLAEGDRFELLQRARDAVSIDYFLQHAWAHRPDSDALVRLIQAAGLAPEWRQRLQQRLLWLKQQTG